MPAPGGPSKPVAMGCRASRLSGRPDLGGDGFSRRQPHQPERVRRGLRRLPLLSTTDRSYVTQPAPLVIGFLPMPPRGTLARPASPRFIGKFAGGGGRGRRRDQLWEDRARKLSRVVVQHQHARPMDRT